MSPIAPTTGDFPLVSSRVLGPRPGATLTTRGDDGALATVPLDQAIAEARRLARALLARGVAPGDVVGTVLPNGRAAFQAVIGVPMAGAVLHPLNPALPDALLGELLAQAGDRVVLCAAPDQARVTGLAPTGVRVLPVDLLDLPAADERSLPAIAEDHPFGILHTSGTTGRPKAVVHSHRAVWLHALAAGLASGFGVARGDTVTSIVQAHHALAIGLPLAAALHGASLVLPGGALGPTALLDLLAATGTTLTGGLSSAFAAVLDALDAEPGRWRLDPRLRILCGGNALHRPIVAGFARHGISTLHTWGMTETGPLATITAPITARADDPRPIAQGHPVPLVEVRIVDVHDRPLPWDGASAGELQVRGAWITAGYAWDNEGTATAPGGWLRTGDQAVIDSDGTVRLVGRSKEGIRVGDRWVGPAGLEACLRAHPAIADVAVVGLPDRHLGERPVAAVVLKGLCPDVRALLPDTLLASAIPVDVHPVAALPRGPTGKVDRAALMRTIEAHGRGLPPNGTDLP